MRDSHSRTMRPGGTHETGIKPLKSWFQHGLKIKRALRIKQANAEDKEMKDSWADVNQKAQRLQMIREAYQRTNKA